MRLSIWRRPAATVFLFWTLVGLCFAAYAYLDAAFEGYAGKAKEVLFWELAGWNIWGAFSFIILWLTHRFPLERSLWPRNLVIHVLLSILFALAHVGLHLTILWIFDHTILAPAGHTVADFQKHLFPRFCWRMMVYFIILIGCHALGWQKRLRREEKKTLELEAQLANAELQALRMQLQPHFLFNTLQSISELMHQDVGLADEMMVRLADFLRLTLDSSGTQEVTLEKELEFLRRYLEIEQIRFKDRLKILIQVEPEVKEALVPNLILQPIVENAIRHGITRSAASGQIEIRAGRAGEVLQVQVKDNGVGLFEQADRDGLFEKGLGLSNTRARLQHAFGLQFRLDLSNAPERGFVVTLQIPLVFK